MINIIYQDDHLIAVHKPAGLLVHPTRQDQHTRGSLMQEVRDQIGQWVYPVHRLDKATSGLVLLALSPEIARALGDQFAQKTIRKTYQAIVRGFITAEGLIDYPLKYLWDKKTAPLGNADKAPQEAQTRFFPLQTVELPFPVGRYQTARFSWVELQPLTGRNRQLRRHMKHIFHPIIGDKKHGDHRQNKFMADYLESSDLLLQASKLELIHPHTQTPLIIAQSPQGPFAASLVRLGWS
ncbi:MAG: pseudouridine synthase [Bacteroidota bacterium]